MTARSTARVVSWRPFGVALVLALAGTSCASLVTGPAGRAGSSPSSDAAEGDPVGDAIAFDDDEVPSDLAEVASVAIDAACPRASLPPTDLVDEGATHGDSIRCLVWYGLANGVTTTRFGTGDAVTRGQLASLLARTLAAAGVELPEVGERAFDDSATSVHGDRLEQLAAVDVFRGTGHRTVEPAATITRAQLASVLARAVGFLEDRPLPPGPDAFRDDDGSVHEAAIDAVAAAGLVQGTGDGRFAPSGHLTRGAAASVVARVLARAVADGRLAVPAMPAMRWQVSELSTSLRREMTGVSWRVGCPVALGDLRLVVLSHRGFDGRLHRGELVVHRSSTAELHRVFAAAYEADFPLQRVVRVDHYGGDDDRSMAANNTHAFNCRRTTSGSGWSEHAYGTAIDLNPVHNPYVRGSTVLPEAGRPYVDRADVRPGMLVDGDPVVRAFDAVGWGWGGRWSTLKDYQHLSRSGR